MQEFSGLYKKMCGTADEIQSKWPKIAQEWDDYCKKGDYVDGITDTLQKGTLTEEELKELYETSIWIPRRYQLRERFFRHHGIQRIKEQVEARHMKYMGDPRLLELVRKHFDHSELVDAITLMFVMDDNYNKTWDFDKGEWIPIKGKL